MEEGPVRAFAACSQFEVELGTYLEGQGSPFVISHSRDCVACGALLADLQSIRQAARTLPIEEPSPLLWANLRAKLEAEGAFHASPCAQFDSELEAYLEGESRPLVTAHARECVPCGVLLQDLQEIRRAAQELPLEEPSRVVWANIRAGLEAEGALGTPVRGWREIFTWRFFPHAIPVGALAVLVFMGSLLTLPSSNMQRLAVTFEASNPSVNQMASVALPGGEQGVLASLSDLETNFRAREASMAPDIKATYEKSLVSLDNSIGECLDSLRHEPSNTLAHDYLLTAYTRKAEILSSALEFEGR